MRNSIWTVTKSAYGQVSGDVKPVSTSTAYRWMVKDSRSKVRKSRTLSITKE